jgi:hypothetical protein
MGSSRPKCFSSHRALLFVVLEVEVYMAWSSAGGCLQVFSVHITAESRQEGDSIPHAECILRSAVAALYLVRSKQEEAYDWPFASCNTLHEWIQRQDICDILIGVLNTVTVSINSTLLLWSSSRQIIALVLPPRTMRHRSWMVDIYFEQTGYVVNREEIKLI